MIARITTALTPLDQIPPQLDLRPNQKEALRTIIDHFNAPDLALPRTEDTMYTEELSDREMMWLSEETIIRFYTATARDSHSGTKKDIVATIERLERTIVWRRSKGLDRVEERARAIPEELETATVMNIGYSSTGMPVVYFLPNRNYLPLQQRSVNTAFFHIERAMDLLVNGQSQIMVLFYFGGKRQGAPATVQITKELISTFAEYYPECLGRSILMSIPWWMKAFLHIVWPFVDSHTKSKVRWISGERAIREGEIPACELLEDCGGNLKLPYEQHQDYLATLIGIALTRREEQYRAWLDLGPPSVGRSERDFRVPPATRSINQLKHSLTDESFE